MTLMRDRNSHTKAQEYNLINSDESSRQLSHPKGVLLSALSISFSALLRNYLKKYPESSASMNLLNDFSRVNLPAYSRLISCKSVHLTVRTH